MTAAYYKNYTARAPWEKLAQNAPQHCHGKLGEVPARNYSA